MRSYVVAAAVSLLAGCGVVDSVKNSEATDYVMVTSSQAGGAYRVLRGDLQLCKLTKHGVSGFGYSLILSDGRCEVRVKK